MTACAKLGCSPTSFGSLTNRVVNRIFRTYLERGVTEFDTYIRNNHKFIPNFDERYRQGDTISTAFVESTINQVVSKRFTKRQQMQWSQKGAHLLLQTRTKVLDGDLEGVFRGWYPQFRPISGASPTH